MKAIILLAFTVFKVSQAGCPSSPCFTWDTPFATGDPSSLQLASPQSDPNCFLSKLSSHDNPLCLPLLDKLSRTFGLPIEAQRTVPVVENHVGHKIVKVIRHVPVLVKVTKPELVVRTHHLPILKHVPVTEKCIRNVERPAIRKVPVVHKMIRPYSYQTVKHVPVNPCCPQALLSQTITGLPVKNKLFKTIHNPQSCLSDVFQYPSSQLCA